MSIEKGMLGWFGHEERMKKGEYEWENSASVFGQVILTCPTSMHENVMRINEAKEVCQDHSMYS